MEIDLSLVESYCEEALELLSRWEIICIELSKREDRELYQELFRIAHNIKGGSRAVGLTDYGDLVHKIEDGITLLRDGVIKLDANVCSLLLDAQKILSDWTLMIRLEPKYKHDYANFLSAYTLVLNENQKPHNESILNSQNKENAEKIEKDLSKIVNEHLYEEKNNNSESIQKVQLAVTDTLNHRTSVELAENAASKHMPTEKKKSGSNESIRIPAQKLDELLQVIGELSIHQSIVWHTRTDTTSTNKMFLNSLQLGQKLTKELYDKALSLRMQPIQSVFQRLERNVLDLSRTLNKEVEVQISGGDVELDKTVIERIIDPLTHIVRNAIDHGIENAEERTVAGKNPKGTIQIIARQDTFGVELIIKDDGKGLDATRIKSKAIENGLIKENQNLQKRQIFELIFLPGFSTAEKVTDISGRGVGMDVVRRTLEDLQGSIQIDSEFGTGTVFNIMLPTSVSIIDAMLISLHGQNYVVPLGAIEEVLNLNTPVQSSERMIVHNNSVLPIQDLEVILSGRRGRSTKSNKSEYKTIIICRHQNRKMGLAIDKVMGQQQVVIRPLNENINGAFGLMGGTILGNGEPGLIIDIPALSDYFVKETQRMESAS